MGCRAPETPEGLLRRDDIDIILNLTPPAAHFATTMAALEAGKHVFCEKTLGHQRSGKPMTLAEAAERARICRLGVAPDSLLGAGLQKARAMIDAGAIGRPLMATASIMYHGADELASESGVLLPPRTAVVRSTMSGPIS